MLFRACCDATNWSLKEQTSSDYTIIFLHRYSHACSYLRIYHNVFRDIIDLCTLVMGLEYIGSRKKTTFIPVLTFEITL